MKSVKKQSFFHCQWTMEKQGWIRHLQYENDHKGVLDEDTLLTSAKIGNEFLNSRSKICFWHRV